MGREGCQMCHIVGSTVYCGFYDFMYAKCDEVSLCPDGLDEDQDEDDYGYDDYEEPENDE